MTTIPKEKQITYAVHVNAKTPYELYLDDILIDDFNENNMNKTTELNPYLLKNGTHTLKIKYLPTTDSPDGLLDPKDVVFNKDSKWNVFFVMLNKDPEAPLGYTNTIDYGTSELAVIPPPEKVPFWEQEWDLEIKNLPYTLKGWSQSQDLSKMDKDVLEKEVLQAFNTYRDLLNKGKIKEYLELVKKKNLELDVATYTTPEQSKIYDQENLKKMTERCTNNMQPIDNYEMRLFANGRLVTLLIPNGEYKNWPALMSVTPKGRTTGWRILLHKPEGSDTFEIIRK